MPGSEHANLQFGLGVSFKPAFCNLCNTSLKS